jgi:ankyrin repeat protein
MKRTLRYLTLRWSSRARLTRLLCEAIGDRDLPTAVRIITASPGLVNTTGVRYRDKPCGTTLHLAVEENDPQAARQLLDMGADPEIAHGDFNFTVLQSAALYGRLEISDVLLSAGANIEAHGESALLISASHQHWDMVGLILSKNPDVDARDRHGWTALHFAAWIGAREVVEALVRQKADVNAETTRPVTLVSFPGPDTRKEEVSAGVTPLRLAERYPRSEPWSSILLLLKDSGAVSKGSILELP